MKLGLWIRDSRGSEYLVTRDSAGYPRLIGFPQKDEFFGNERAPLDLAPDEGRRLYQEVTGSPYPYLHATSRQVIWDLIEASLKLLP